MNMRYVGAVIYLIPVLIITFLGGVYLKYGMMIFSLMAMFEFYKALNSKNYKPVSALGYGLCIIYYFYLEKIFSNDILILILIPAVIIALIIPIFNEKINFVDGMLSVFGFLYIGVLLSFLPIIQSGTYGKYLVWVPFISTWSCDTGAYYVGRFFGKKKLCPKVSPKKTIEGAVGGFFGSIIVCVLFGVVIRNFGANINLIHLSVIGALGGIIGQLGDLTASAIKRYVGIKDFSEIIPGHGGILDRFDSILFVGTVVYYYVSIIMRL